jgi:hypothetical protein
MGDTSSLDFGMSSSPLGFDFSQLPPSSPHFEDMEFGDMALDFPSVNGRGSGFEGSEGSCSALLMSSPEDSPFENGGLGRRVSPRKVGMEKAFDSGYGWGEVGMDFGAVEDLLKRGGGLGGEELLALLNGQST